MKEKIELNIGDVILADIEYITQPMKIVKDRQRRELLLEKQDGSRFWWDESRFRKVISKGKDSNDEPINDDPNSNY